jgi:hypothetical protein
MKKRVRYAITAMAAPAVGVMIPAVGAVTTDLPAADAATCAGHVGNHHTASGTTVRFYSAAISGRTCIGTIETDHPGISTNTSLLGGDVINANGKFCGDYGRGPKFSWPCKESFVRTGLHVAGNMFFAGAGSGGTWYPSSSYYPFKHNGF